MPRLPAALVTSIQLCASILLRAPTLLRASILLLAPLLPLAALTARADTYRSDGRYDPGVPTPSSVLGFELGSRPARHAEIARYAEALAAASPRVRLETYAKSHEGRELFVLVISSESNLARLDAIRAGIATIADPRRPSASGETGETDRLIASTPAIAYLAYGIHGDELSSGDAALRVAYELAAGETGDVRKLHDELVVLVDPAENPDGRERILSMTAAYMGAVPNPDPDGLSHEGFWPWGRANHYLFDLNRDWFTLVHPESRGRAGVLRSWRPQLVVDSHEMGSDSTYLFSPPRAPFNPNFPASARPWWDRFARDQAREFDRRGWSYYTREWNEEFFPGYGSALAMYQGAIGILYEQASTGGTAIRKPHGGLLTYEESVAHQFVSSLANLTTAAANRAELLRSYREARAEAIERGRKGPVRAFYFTPRPDAARAARLASRLAMLGIEVERLKSAGTIDGARSFWSDGASKVSLPAGSFRVRLDQPDGLLARAVLEPHTPMPDSFLAEEREHLERQKGTRLYDVTAWSPLVASGLDAWWSGAADSLSWERVETVEPPAGRVLGGAATYGWLFDGTSDGAIGLAARLAARGLKVRLGDKAIEVEGRRVPPGSFLLRAEENPPAAHETIRDLVPASGVEVLTVATALIEKGHDLGADRWTLLDESRIAIAAGSPLDFTSVGAAWHLLDREMGLRASLIDVSRIAEIDLARYNVIVLPSARAGAYRRVVGDDGLKALREWTEHGGTLVGLGGGAEFAADEESKLSKVRPRRQVLKEFPGPRFGLGETTVRSLERMQSMGIGPDGQPTPSTGLYSEDAWPRALGIPGPGSAVLGPGTWAMLGDAGDAARRRGSLMPPDRSSAQDDKDKKDGGAPAEKEKEKDASASGSGRTGGGADKPRADSTKGGVESPEAKRSEAEEEAARTKADERLRRFFPSGALLRVDLDPEHWLAFGAGDRTAVMVRARDVLLARDPVATAARFATPETLHLGGLLWPEAAGRIAQTAFLTREAVGRGQIILFSNDPNFRGYFWGSERLFLNAVLLGPGAGTRRTTPW